MSIVGPRPEREFFVSQFIKDNKEFGYRTSVKAGITGLASKYTGNILHPLRTSLDMI